MSQAMLTCLHAMVREPAEPKQRGRTPPEAETVQPSGTRNIKPQPPLDYQWTYRKPLP